MTFEELYTSMLRQNFGKGDIPPEANPEQLACLLHPERYAPVIKTESCETCEYDRACEKSCIFDAIVEEQGEIKIDPARCVGCSVCVESCKLGKLTASRDILPALRAVREKKGPAYALIAPAFLGQFSDKVTPGKLRSAFAALGFDGMVEVALFADILTFKEAIEFDRNVNRVEDYQLTSCCCPVWIAMIRKIYSELMPHMPAAVSPMIACGRVVKKLHPDAVTVFIGPCVAKKSEAREPDIADAIDYVLTFEEVRDVFQAAEIDPALLPDRKREHSSRAGRIYARTGGVSEAVSKTVAQMRPGRALQVRPRQADGVPACRAMVEEIRAGRGDANFFEGMGCRGGCVGGPKAILTCAEGRARVDAYGDAAETKTPLENPFVPELLERLGFQDVESFLEESDLFQRDFGVKK